VIHIPGKLIFIKPKKVGGTTMELLLSAACSGDAAVTPLTIWNLNKGEGDSIEQAIDEVVSRPHVNLRRYGLHRTWRGERKPYALILRPEELHRELPLLEALAGLELPASVPHAKGSTRLDRRPADAILSERQKRLMEHVNRPLFELWDKPPKP